MAVNAEALSATPDEPVAAPLVSEANWNPEIVSTWLPVMPRPVAVSVVLVSVKLTSVVRVSISSFCPPVPPIKVSPPPLWAMIVLLPDPPSR